MKNILMCAAIFILLSFQAKGQEPQDTLYLKNGQKAIGKLLKRTNAEYRFQTTDGVVFTFSPDEVQKIEPSTSHISLTSPQKTLKTDGLTIDQLNLYKDIAVKLSKTGKILTLGGVSLTGISIVLMAASFEVEGGSLLDTDFVGYALIAGFLGGVTTTIVGIPLWAVGGSRKSRANLTLQKFILVPENSMAFGLGIKVTF